VLLIVPNAVLVLYLALSLALSLAWRSFVLAASLVTFSGTAAGFANGEAIRDLRLGAQLPLSGPQPSRPVFRPVLW
jgi:hypothetical protein